MIEFFPLGSQSQLQPFQYFQQRVEHLQRRQPDGGRDDIIGRLGHVDVVVGVQHAEIAPLLPQQLQGAVGQHFVDIHIVRSSGPGLKRINNKLVGQLAGQRFVGRCDDGIADLFLQPPGGHIGDGGTALDDHCSPGKSRMRFQSGDRKVVQGPGGLCAIIGAGRHRHFSHGIFFNACSHVSPRFSRYA